MPAALEPCSQLGIQSAQGIRRGSCAAFAPAAFTHRHDSFRSRRAGRVRRGCRITGIAAASAGALTLATSAFMFRFVLDTQAPLSMMKLVRAGKVPGAKLEGVRVMQPRRQGPRAGSSGSRSPWRSAVRMVCGCTAG